MKPAHLEESVKKYSKKTEEKHINNIVRE